MLHRTLADVPNDEGNVRPSLYKTSSQVPQLHLRAAGHVRGQQQHQTGFGKFHQRVVGPFEKAIQPCRAMKSLTQRPEMQGQEQGQQQA